MNKEIKKFIKEWLLWLGVLFTLFYLTLNFEFLEGMLEVVMFLTFILMVLCFFQLIGLSIKYKIGVTKK